MLFQDNATYFPLACFRPTTLIQRDDNLFNIYLTKITTTDSFNNICTSKAPTVHSATYHSGSHLPRESNFRLILFNQTSKTTLVVVFIKARKLEWYVLFYCVFKSFVLILSCFCYAFVRVCLLMPCGHLLGKGQPHGSRL